MNKRRYSGDSSSIADERLFWDKWFEAVWKRKEVSSTRKNDNLNDETTIGPESSGSGSGMFEGNDQQHIDRDRSAVGRILRGALSVTIGGDGDDASEKMVGGGHTSETERNHGTNGDDGDFDSFGDDFDDVVIRLARTMHTKPITGQHRFISSVIAPDGLHTVRECLQELDNLIDRYPPRHWHIVASHGDHVHVAHACAYNNGSCRCPWLLRSTFWAKDEIRRLRSITRGVELRPIDYVNVLRNLSEGTKFLHRIGGFAEDGELCDRYKCLSERRYERQRKGGLLDGSRREDSCDFQSKEPVRQPGQLYGEKDGSGNSNVKKRQKITQDSQFQRPANWPLTTTQLLYEYPTCPPEDFHYIKEFYLNDTLKNTLTNNKYVKQDLRNWCAKLGLWKLSDFNNYYNDPNVKPYFNGYSTNNDNVYYDVDTSVKIANQLLLHQYENDTEQVRNFLIDLLNVIDKRVPKLNTLAIHGETNAGKNYFFDAVVAYFINYGYLGTIHKNNNFAFMDAADRRIILWNGPQYEANHVRQVKELLAGETTRVRVKYRDYVSVQGTPIIMLTDKMLSIFEMSELRSSIRLHRWKRACFLQDYNKKIDPRFLLKMFYKYNIHV